MQRQTQPTQVFTVFGSYVLDERQEGYFPATSGRSDSQDRRLGALAKFANFVTQISGIAFIAAYLP